VYVKIYAEVMRVKNPAAEIINLLRRKVSLINKKTRKLCKKNIKNKVMIKRTKFLGNKKLICFIPAYEKELAKIISEVYIKPKLTDPELL